MATTGLESLATTTVDGDRAVLAHLMLNSLTAMLGATSTLRHHGALLDEATHETLLGMVSREAAGLRGAMTELVDGRTAQAFSALTNRGSTGAGAGLPEGKRARAERFMLIAAQLTTLEERMREGDPLARRAAVNVLQSMPDVDIVDHRDRSARLLVRLSDVERRSLVADDPRWATFSASLPSREPRGGGAARYDSAAVPDEASAPAEQRPYAYDDATGLWRWD